jgi:hypothetical protein
MFWTGVLVGTFIGGLFGVAIMAIMGMAKNAGAMESEADAEASDVDGSGDSNHCSDPFARADRSRNGERF